MYSLKGCVREHEEIATGFWWEDSTVRKNTKRERDSVSKKINNQVHKVNQDRLARENGGRERTLPADPILARVVMNWAVLG